MKSGEVYNIGGRNEHNNNLIADRIYPLLDEMIPLSKNVKLKMKKTSLTPYKRLITFVGDRAGNDRRYAIDSTKIETEFGWKAGENFGIGIVKTIKWDLEKYGVE